MFFFSSHRSYETPAYSGYNHSSENHSAAPVITCSSTVVTYTSTYQVSLIFWRIPIKLISSLSPFTFFYFILRVGTGFAIFSTGSILADEYTILGYVRKIFLYFQKPVSSVSPIYQTSSTRIQPVQPQIIGSFSAVSITFFFEFFTYSSNFSNFSTWIVTS